MSKQVIQMSGIAAVFLIGAAVVWQFITIERLGTEPSVDIKPIDYTPLERAVAAWQGKKPFSMAGSDLAPQTDGSEDAAGEEDDEEVILRIMIRYTAGFSEEATDMQEALLALENLEVTTEEASEEFETTTMTYAEAADIGRINEIAGVLAPVYGQVTRTVVSQATDEDIVIELISLDDASE